MKRTYIIMLLISILTLTFASASTFKIASAQGYPGPYYTVENIADNSSKITMGPSPATGQNFTVAIKLNNVTTGNVAAGVAGVEVHLTWDNTLIEPVAFVDMVGKAGGALKGPTILYGIQPGFYDSGGNPIASAPFINATHYVVAAASSSGGWWGDRAIVAEITFKVDSQPQPFGTCPLAIDSSDISDALAAEVAYSIANATYTITTTATTSESVSFQGVNYPIAIASDSNITAPANMGFQNFTNDGASLTFNVTSPDGFANVTIPNNFMWSIPTTNWTITIDNTAAPQSTMITSDSANTYVWFNWTATGTHMILLQSTNVVPEFAATSLMLFLMTATLIGAAAATGFKRRKLHL